MSDDNSPPLTLNRARLLWLFILFFSGFSFAHVALIDLALSGLAVTHLIFRSLTRSGFWASQLAIISLAFSGFALTHFATLAFLFSGLAAAHALLLAFVHGLQFPRLPRSVSALHLWQNFIFLPGLGSALRHPTSPKAG